MFTFYLTVLVFGATVRNHAAIAQEIAREDRTLRLKTRRKGTPCAIIGDAGSSGTRIYLFHGEDVATASHAQIKGGLAKEGVQKTMIGLAPLLVKTLGEYREYCDSKEDPIIFILGTAGTRLIPEDERNKLWRDLEKAVKNVGHFKAGEFRTLSGTEEGLFALIGANFLEGALDNSLTPTAKGLVGVMDLGGASTQIALPHGTPSKSVSKDDFFIESYLGYGVNELKKAIIDKHGSLALDKACRYSDSSATHPCQEFVTKFFDSMNWECTKTRRCDGPVPKAAPLVSSINKVYMMSGYIYTMKFARWVDPTIDLSKPASINDIQGWAAKVCGQNYDALKAKYKAADPSSVAHTAESQFDERCLHIQYVLVLIRTYGFTNVDKKIFHFSDTINGKEVDWPLGAYLYQKEHGSLPDTPHGWSPIWILWFFILVGVCMIWNFKVDTKKTVKTMYTSVESSSIGHKYVV